MTELPQSATRRTADEPALPGHAPASAITIIEPSRGWGTVRLRELWERRELLYFLAWRDIAVRYKQAVVGVAWALLSPLLLVIVYTIVFSKLARFPSEGIPYPVFFLAAMLPWKFFSQTFSSASTSLVTNANMLRKIYFPRLFIPASAVLAGLVDFLLTFLVLIGLMVWFKVSVTLTILLAPVFLLLAVLAALAVGLWLSALHVRYRDVQHMLPLLAQVWMFASPIIYPVSMIPEGLPRTLYSLNPMVGVLQGCRWTMVGGQPPDPLAVVSSLVLVLGFLVGGVYYFKRVETTFADVV